MENHDSPDPPPPDDLWSRRRWLSRLAFSFLIIAIYLAWTAYHATQAHRLSFSRAILYYVGALFAFGLFLMGTRAKHRP